MKVSKHLDGILEPLTEATCKLLAEQEGLQPYDYARISLEHAAFENDKDGHGNMKRFVVKLCSRDPNHAPSWAIRDQRWHGRIPGAKPMMSLYGFTCPPSDTSALIILAALGHEHIEYEDEEAQLEFMSAVLRFAKTSRVTKAPAGFKSFHTVPNDAPLGSKHWPPMPAQRVAAWAIERSEAYSLWMEQSTGKTYAAIMGIESSYTEGECHLVCIVCPKNVRYQWASELERFSTKRIKVVRLLGGQIERMQCLLEVAKAKISGEYDFVYLIASYEGVSRTASMLMAYPWKWLVADEAHFIKSRGAQRTKAMLKLRDKAERKITLTGTPISNTLLDVYTQLEFLGHGYSGFTSYHQFKNFYGEYEYINNSKVLVGVQNLPLLQERLARYSFLLTKKEALPDLPNKTYDMIEVEMTEGQRKVYNAVATQIYTEIEQDLERAKTDGRSEGVTVNNVLTRLLRLSQITSGFLVRDGEIDPETGIIDNSSREIERFDPNPKLEALIEFIKDQQIVAPESKIIVWCCYTQDIKTIHARLGIEGINSEMYFGHTKEDKRAEIQQRWNEDPTLTVVIGNPAAGGVGLNLQGWCPMVPNATSGDQFTRADKVVFYSQNWSPTTRAQGEERPRGYVHQSKTLSGKQESWSIRCIDLCVPDSIDWQIRSRVMQKRINALRIQDVREILAQLISKGPITATGD